MDSLSPILINRFLFDMGNSSEVVPLPSQGFQTGPEAGTLEAMSAAPNLPVPDLLPLLEGSIAARADLFEPAHTNAFRLFNGFLEGWPALVVDVYGTTAVLFDYADDPEQGGAALTQAAGLLQSRLPWLTAGLTKRRTSSPVVTTLVVSATRKGSFLWGDRSADRILENNVWYALDLFMNQDASFYLDTRNLRSWAKQNLAGRTVLNAFAYTGSLGVAACAGGASRVVQLDLSRHFLNVAKTSCTLNGFPIHKADFIAGDFYSKVSHFKRTGERFDCVLLDPPFFSVTSKGVVDQAGKSARLINKVRPLVSHQGWLVTINNALFLSGEDYMGMLQALCADGYLSIEELIPVPPDFTGFPGTRLNQPPVDPAPFNHPTKIAVLRVTRKDNRI